MKRKLSLDVESSVFSAFIRLFSMKKDLNLLEKIICERLPVAGAMETKLQGLVLHRRETVHDVENLIYQPTLVLTVAGNKQTRMGTQTFDFAPGDCFLTSICMPAISTHVSASHEKPFLAVSLRLDLSVVFRMTQEFASAGGVRCGQSSQGMGTFQANERLIDAFVRLLELEEEPEIARVVRPLIEAEIYCRLLTGPAAQMLASIVLPMAAAGRIAESIRYIRSSYREPLDIAKLSSSAHMSSSTFFRQFRRLTHLSPVQYQKQVRLQEARKLMLEKSFSAVHAAMEVGYESPAQFSRDYKRLFGRPPKKDVCCSLPLQ